MKTDEVKTVFVCNTITGGVYEVKKGFDIDETSIQQIQKRAKARGEEYMAVVLPGDVKHGDIEKYAYAVADLRRLQDPRIQEIVYRTQKAIEILTDGTEKPDGET